MKNGALAGLAAASLPASAESVAAQSQGNAQPLRDPRTRFPNDQPTQQQAWPGLQRDMMPRPDCGEMSYRGSGRLVGRCALTTGGDSGIGRAAAIAYAHEGADVAINYLSQEEPDAAEVVDLIVSNAGYGWFLPDILKHPSEKFDQTIKTNLYAPFWFSKAAIAMMKPGSAIVFTTSVTAFSPADAFLDYSATKAAIVALTSALAKQVARRGIRVNGVAPGPIWTPMQVYFGAPRQQCRKSQRIHAARTHGHPVEMAPLYVALAKGASSFVTGSTWSADGGRL